MSVTQVPHAHASLDQLVFGQLATQSDVSVRRNKKFKVRSSRVDVVQVNEDIRQPSLQRRISQRSLVPVSEPNHHFVLFEEGGSYETRRCSAEPVLGHLAVGHADHQGTAVQQNVPQNGTQSLAQPLQLFRVITELTSAGTATDGSEKRLIHS